MRSGLSDEIVEAVVFSEQFKFDASLEVVQSDPNSRVSFLFQQFQILFILPDHTKDAGRMTEMKY